MQGRLVRGRALAVASAVIAMAIVAFVGVAAVRHHRAADPIGGVLTSRHWRLTGVVSPGGVANRPAPHGGISFFPDGRVLADDGVNPIDSTYHFVGSGRIAYDHVFIGAVGYGGDDPAQLATIDAFMSAFGPSRIAVAGSTGKGSLTIRTDDGWVLTFAGDGPLPRE